MATSKKTDLASQGAGESLPEQSRMRLKSRDPDLRALEAAQQQWLAGAISEREYIEQAIVAMMREVDPLMTQEDRDAVASGLRYICNTSPEMRTRLGLDPFGEAD